mgnify:FL=1|tara:strand:- start:1774 stop:2352 length:579 start_codon:yes stop_codon:yes gene_type:complete
MNDENLNLDPEFELELLTLSDPKVRANMMRYSMALRIALTGRKDHDPSLRILIGMGFTMSDETDEAYQEATRRDGCDRLYLRFDVDDALGPPDGMGLVRLEDDRTVLYGRCNLWMPQSAGRPVIVFEHEGRYGHFAYRPGSTLVRVDSLPANDHRPGFKRAQDRLAALVASKRLQKVTEPFITMRMAEAKEQ